MADPQTDETELIEVPQETDETEDETEERTLTDLGDDEIAALQGALTYFLPDGKTFEDILANTGRFGTGDNTTYRFVPPDDWDVKAPAKTDEVDTEVDTETDSQADDTAGTVVVTQQQPAPKPAPKVTRRTVARPHPAKTTKQQGPVRKKPEDLTDDDLVSIWKDGLKPQSDDLDW